MPAIPSIIWLKDCAHYSYSLVGEKGVELGKLSSAKLPIPNGFILPSTVFIELMAQNHLHDTLADIFAQIDPQHPETITQVTKEIKQAISKVVIPESLAIEIVKAYQKLGKEAFVAIRPSKTDQKLPPHHSTALNIQGDANVIETVRKIWADQYPPHVLTYLYENQRSPSELNISIAIQAMTQSNVAGVMFTNNPENNNKRSVVIDVVWGLGEYILNHQDQADRYEIEKYSWEILSQQKNTQTHELVRKLGTTKQFPLPASRKSANRLTQKQLVKLAQLAIKVQQFLFFPQRIEWAMEGDSIYILQSEQLMPVTNLHAQIQNKHHQRPLLYGSAVHAGLISGEICVIRQEKDLSKLQTGQIAVIAKLPQQWIPNFKKASGIICDAPIYPLDVQHLGIPIVGNTHFATTILKPHHVVTIYGQQGIVYDGQLHQTESSANPEPAVLEEKTMKDKVVESGKMGIFLSTGEPENAVKVDADKVAGVGLLRAEYMIASLGIHPKKLLHDQKEHLYTQALEKGITKVCTHFRNKPVIYRFLDFTASEMRLLKGGDQFEPVEENPKLGYRGAYRYLTDPRVFNLELQVLAKLRADGHTNLHVMLPFVRSVDEFFLLKKNMEKFGLTQENGVQIWLMVDTPSVALNIEAYIKLGVDGIAIGAQDLLLLLTGLDHTDETHTSLSYTHDPAFKQVVQSIVHHAHAQTKPVLFCEHIITAEIMDLLKQTGCDGVSANASQLSFLHRSIR